MSLQHASTLKRSSSGSIIDTFIYRYIHIQMHSYTDTFIYRCIHIQMHSYTDTFIYRYIHIQMHSYTDAFIYRCIHIQMHSYTDAFIYRYIHILIHSYTDTFVLRSTQYTLHFNLNRASDVSLCWPTLLEYINYTPWRWPFKGRNMLEWRIVLIKWCFNNICEQLSVFIGYNHSGIW